MSAKRRAVCTLLMGSLSLGSLLPLSGCQETKENPRTSGAVIGGVGGAAIGAAVTKDRALGALLGGALGAGGGYLIGTQVAKNNDQHKNEAIQASQQAQQNPATPASVQNSQTADLNNDGFVTMDEVVAMKQAGLSDDEMIRRLRATGQTFALTTDQEQYLRNHGVDTTVIQAMETMTPPATQPTGMGSQVIGKNP